MTCIVWQRNHHSLVFLLLDTAPPADDPRYWICDRVDLDDCDGGPDGTPGISLKMKTA